LKKPVQIKTAARFFPDEVSEGTTAIQITIEGRITAPPVLLPFQWQRGSPQLHPQKKLRSIGLVRKPWKEQAKRLKQNRFFDL